MRNLLLILFYIAISFPTFSQEKINIEQMEYVITNPQTQLLDVRTKNEYNEGHLPNSLNVDWKNQENFIEVMNTLNKQEPVYVYCLSGGRSKQASKLLAENGFKVYNYSGGMLEWRSKEKPEIKSDNIINIKGLTYDDFENKIHSNKLVLVNFSAVWCLPCQELKPIIDKIEKEQSSKIKVIRIDADQNKELLKVLNIRGIPKLSLFNDGKEVWTKNGLATELEILKEISSAQK